MIECIVFALGFFLLAISLPPLALVGLMLMFLGIALRGVRDRNESRWD